MKKWYVVYDGHSDEGARMLLTDAEVVDYRRDGYYVREA